MIRFILEVLFTVAATFALWWWSPDLSKFYLCGSLILIIWYLSRLVNSFIKGVEEELAKQKSVERSKHG